MTPDVPLSENVTVWSVNECGDESKYMTRDGNGSWVHIDDYRALASERDELKYKMQVMADMVGEENWSLRNQLADAQARVKVLESLMHRATVHNVTPERVAEIRHILGSCSLEADATPTLADEMDAYARQLEEELLATAGRRDQLNAACVTLEQQHATLRERLRPMHQALTDLLKWVEEVREHWIEDDDPDIESTKAIIEVAKQALATGVETGEKP